ncbi:MAG: adenylate/guanylate cyclase domain-containing protein [Reyranellaceae bacterium]
MSSEAITPGVQRRLVAVLVADIAGYSGMVERDEVGTVARWRRWRREVIEPSIARHKGRLVKTTGDGFLAEFQSAVAAVLCGVEIQRLGAARNVAAASVEPIALRMGLNLGDLIIEGGDIYGDGVNVAARLEALAPPGGLLISRAVRDQIRDKLPFPFEDEGEHRVKNLSRPIRAFLLRPEVIAALPEPNLEAGPLWTGRRRLLTFLALLAAALVLATGAWVGGRLLRPGVVDGPAPISIAVLPFSGASDDPEHAVLADAITENLITDLSRISGAFVIASSTSFTFRDKAVDPRDVAAELKVRYVLSGSVRRTGDAVQVTANLVDGESGSQIWGERFDRSRAEVGDLQQEVTGRIARTLNLELKEAASRRSVRLSGSALAADDLALQAWAEIWSKPQSRETNAVGLDLAQQALALDRNHADALATAAYAYVRAGSFGWTDDKNAALQQGLAAAERAVALDPNNADAQYVLSYALRSSGDRTRGEEVNRLCVELNPNHAPGVAGLGLFALLDGRAAEASEYFGRALTLSPRDPLRAVWYNWMSVAALVSDDPATAEVMAIRALAANPNFRLAELHLGVAYSRLGRSAEAATTLARFRDNEPSLFSTAALEARTFRQSSDRAAPLRTRYLQYLREAGVPDR